MRACVRAGEGGLAYKSGASLECCFVDEWSVLWIGWMDWMDGLDGWMGSWWIFPCLVYELGVK